MARYLRVLHQGSPRFVELVDGALHLLDGAPWAGGRVLDQTLPISSAPLVPVSPSKIICVAKNYREHAKEMQGEVPEEPLLFFKPPSSLLDPGGSVVLPPGVERTDFEAELGVVIGRDAKDVGIEDALGFVLGYCCVNDVSARWWQKEGSGGQFCLGKSFDTFCPIGPAVVEAEGVGDPQDLEVVCRVNGVEMQRASTGQMMFGVADLIARLSRGTTLGGGTLILTGTPSGVGMARDPRVWLGDGDVVEVEIERVGVLRNPVRFG